MLQKYIGFNFIADSFISGHYFVLGNYNVFSIDVTPWVNSVVRAYNFGVGRFGFEFYF